MAITQHETTSTYTGLSTDTKPTNVNNGTAFLEMDTGSIYFYDAASEEWLEWSSSSGGGSSDNGSNSNILALPLEVNPGTSVTMLANYQTVANALTAHKLITTWYPDGSLCGIVCSVGEYDGYSAYVYSFSDSYHSMVFSADSANEYLVSYSKVV